MKKTIKKYLIKDKILEFLQPTEIGRVNNNSSFSLATTLEVERYLVSTMLDHMQLDGYVTNIETSSKLDGGMGGKLSTITPVGLYFIHEGGYTKIQRKEFRQKTWVITKTIAAVLNALLILGIAAWGVKTQIDANRLEEKSKQVKSLNF